MPLKPSGHTPRQCSPEALIDPAWAVFWQRQAELAMVGPGVCRRWGWRDGAEPGAVGFHQHAVATLVVCLLGSVRIVGRTVQDLHPGESLIIAPGCWHCHIQMRHRRSYMHLGMMRGRTDVLLHHDDLRIWSDAGDAELHQQSFGRDQREDTERVRQVLMELRYRDLVPIDWGHHAVEVMAAKMWNNLHRDVSVTDLLQIPDVGLHRASELFHGFFGRSVRDELHEQRAALARSLMDDTMMPDLVLSWTGMRNRLALRRLLGESVRSYSSARLLAVRSRPKQE